MGGDKVVLQIEKLRRCGSMKSVTSSPRISCRASCSSSITIEDEEEVKLVKMGECRICQEDDDINNLEAPCACNGSLKFVHRSCVQRWCDEKGDTICEICHQPFGPSYVARNYHLGLNPLHPDDTSIDMSGRWRISGSPPADFLNNRFRPADLHNYRLVPQVERSNQPVNTETLTIYLFRVVVLLVLGVYIIRQAFDLGTINPKTAEATKKAEEEMAEMFYTLMLRVFGFLLPCYFGAWVISVIQHRRNNGEGWECYC